MPNEIASRQDVSVLEDRPTAVPLQARWEQLPDQLLLAIFRSLYPRSLLRASQVCRQWYRVAVDEFLWKDLIKDKFKILPEYLSMAPHACCWLDEYKRLYAHTPYHESEVLTEHRDQVLHVSFSSNGKYFATSSKDGSVKVWEFGYPTYVKYYEDMRTFNWRYTQYTQFNESDTLLLVSGVHFGNHTTSGEIAVFNMQDGFALQCTVRNKPYDIFGTWYDDEHLLSGNLHWLGNFSSCSVLYLNKSSQDLDNIYESVVMQLYKFLNINASSVRTIMVADCIDSGETCDRKKNCVCGEEMEYTMNAFEMGPVGQRLAKSHGQRCVRCGGVTGSSPVESDTEENDTMSEDETGANSGRADSTDKCNRSTGEMGHPHMRIDEPVTSNRTAMEVQTHNEDSSKSPIDCERLSEEGLELGTKTSNESVINSDSNKTNRTDERHPLPCRFGRGGECSNSILCPAVKPQNNPSTSTSNNTDSPRLSSLLFDESEATNAGECSGNKRDKYLIFTTGTRTFTPHQIGIKRMRYEDALGKMSKQAEVRRLEIYRLQERMRRQAHERLINDAAALAGNQPNNDGRIENEIDDDDDDSELLRQMDPVDFTLDLNGHIIGMVLSPDHRRRHRDRIKKILVRQRNSPKNDVDDEAANENGADGNAANPVYHPELPLLDDDEDTGFENGDPFRQNMYGDSDDEEDEHGGAFSLDVVDHLIEMDGHIIGMCLSRDQRYLYVNTRAWPPNYNIVIPLEPPPIAQQIEIHVIDLVTMTDLGVQHHAHKAFTPNDECFFIFLDVCDQYVASGAEDQHGYLWDRHYRVLLNKFKHTDVVNCVAFHPKDPETLISVSDDNSVKIWRSRNRCRQLGIDLTHPRSATLRSDVETTLNDGQEECDDNEHGAPMNEQGAQINEQGAQINEQGAHINEQGAQMNEQGAHINEQGAPLNELGEPSHELGAPINVEHINEQSAPINDHAADLLERLHEHAAMAEEDEHDDIYS